MKKILMTISKTGTYKVIATNAVNQKVSNNVYVFSVNSCFYTLRDVFPNPKNIGIFSYISTMDIQLSVTLNNILEGDLPSVHDVEYIYNRSGDKILSPLIQNLIQETQNEGIEKKTSIPFSVDDIDYISRILSARYSEKWNKLFNLYKEKYDALSPYDMEIDESGQDSLTSDQTRTSTGNSKENVFGYDNDSENGSPDNETNSNTSSTDNYKRENPYSRNITRKGNIGNITKQELVAKEREVLKWQLWDVIYGDLDNVLTSGIYLRRG